MNKQVNRKGGGEGEKILEWAEKRKEESGCVLADKGLLSKVFPLCPYFP